MKNIYSKIFAWFSTMAWSVLAGFAIAMPGVMGNANAATPAHTNTTIPSACYGGKIAAPPVYAQTLLLIDRTAFKDPVAWRDFESSVLAVIQQSGQRLVVLPFAGIAPGQVLARAIDVVIEPPLEDKAREDYIIRDFKRTQVCVARRHAAITSNVKDVLDELRREADEPLARSEILYTIERSLSDFATTGLTTRVLIFSDGLQNGSGMSFYRAGQPRDINPGEETKRLRNTRLATAGAPSVVQARASNPKLRVFWWGLLSGDTPAKPGPHGAHYLNAQILSHYTDFWRTVLSDLGASKVDIGPTLNNPALLNPSP